MNKILFFVACLALFTVGGRVFAMSSTNFYIPWDSVNTGGSDQSSSTNFSMFDTVGDNGTGTSTSGNFQLSAGYRANLGDNSLSYQIQSKSAAVSTAFTAFNNGADTVTVASAAGFNVGDLIAVIENNGFSQLVSVGRITQIVGTIVSVDSFDGDDVAMSPIPAGGDDFVYLLDSNSINFGTIANGTEYTSVVGTSVLSSVASGYSLYIQADQVLQNASAQTINSVSDGTVSLGSEEYGAEVTGSTSFSPGVDIAVTTTQRVIQTSLTSTGPISNKVPMIYKLSISPGTNSGVYSQNVYYTLTANY